MVRHLQTFEFDASPYENPTRKWVCGWAAQGKACYQGPDAKGRCRTTSECQPLRKGDRWFCSRPSGAGGKCTAGPLPDGACSHSILRCAPVPSLRKRRGMVVRTISAFTAGILLLLIGGANGPNIISPGDLTVQHAELQDCKSCHSTFGRGPSDWLRAAFADSAGANDSRLCLSCHFRGDYVFSPHGQSPRMLAAMQDRAQAPSRAGTEPLVVALARGRAEERGAMDSMPCASCHKEHKGRNADLKAMSDARCQACHETKFADLANGHPEFVRYPFKRRTRLVFDHISHLIKYFLDDKFAQQAPAQCTTCHQPEPAGGIMLVAGFETACAGCHARELESAGRPAPMITIPGFDLEELRTRRAAIGEWPEDADAELSPYMVFLLSGEPGFMAAWAVVKDLSLMDDLAEAKPAQIRAVQTIAWSVKSLMADLRRSGGGALRARLEAALGRELSNQELSRLAGRLPVDLIQNAQRDWFPNLISEVKSHRAGHPVAMPAPAGGDAVESAAAEKAASESAAAGDGGDILASGDILSGGDILAGDGKDDGDILSGDILSGDGKDGDGESSEDTASGRDSQESRSGDAVPNYDWTTAGGWYRDDFSLMYRPAGHEDGFFQTWLDTSGAAEGETVGQVFAALTAPQAPGKCTKCHSIEATGRNVVKVNWTGAVPTKGHRRFTRFSHTTHSKLLTEKGCLTCHNPDPQSDYLAGFKSRDATKFVGNFKPMDRKTCTECHTEELAEQSCVLCHNYHIGIFPPAVVPTPMTLRAIGNRPQP